MWNKIVIKYGVILFLGLTIYFLLMRLAGLSDRYDFRMLNALIQIVVIYLAIQKYAETNRSAFTYLSGTVVGISTTVVGVIPFAMVQMVHLYLNTTFLEHIQQNAPVIGPYINPFSGGLIVFVEGLAVGLILSYICMRIVDLRISRQESST